MRFIEVAIFNPGDLLAVADAEGRVTLYRVMPAGTLAPASETSNVEVVEAGSNRMSEVTLDSTIDEWSQAFGLSVRSYNVLAREGIKTWRQLIDLYELKGSEGLFELRNLGFKACEEIVAAIQEWKRAE